MITIDTETKQYLQALKQHERYWDKRSWGRPINFCQDCLHYPCNKDFNTCKLYLEYKKDCSRIKTEPILFETRYIGWTQALIDKLVTLYKEGTPMGDICNTFNASDPTIQKTLRFAETLPKYKGINLRRQKNKIDYEPYKEEIFELLKTKNRLQTYHILRKKYPEFKKISHTMIYQKIKTWQEEEANGEI